jgi:hypothetical protein
MPPSRLRPYPFILLATAAQAPKLCTSSCSTPLHRLVLLTAAAQAPPALCFTAGQAPPSGFLLLDAIFSLSPAGSRATATGPVLPKPPPSPPLARHPGHLWRSRATTSRTPTMPYSSDSRRPRRLGLWLAPTPKRRQSDAPRTP